MRKLTNPWTWRDSSPPWQWQWPSPRLSRCGCVRLPGVSCVLTLRFVCTAIYFVCILQCNETLLLHIFIALYWIPFRFERKGVFLVFLRNFIWFHLRGVLLVFLEELPPGSKRGVQRTQVAPLWRSSSPHMCVLHWCPGCGCLWQLMIVKLSTPHLSGTFLAGSSPQRSPPEGSEVLLYLNVPMSNLDWSDVQYYSMW